MSSTQPSTVTHEKDGKTIVATYHVEHGMVTVSCELGSNTTQVGVARLNSLRDSSYGRS